MGGNHGIIGIIGIIGILWNSLERSMVLLSGRFFRDFYIIGALVRLTV